MSTLSIVCLRYNLCLLKSVLRNKIQITCTSDHTTLLTSVFLLLPELLALLQMSVEEYEQLSSDIFATLI